MGHIIGIDVGSQSVKGILLSPEAGTLGVASAASAMSNAAPGWADQSPSAWEHGIEQVVRQLISAAGLDPAAVTHLGLACQVDGVVPVGRSGAPLATGSSGWTTTPRARHSHWQKPSGPSGCSRSRASMRTLLT